MINSDVAALQFLCALYANKNPDSLYSPEAKLVVNFMGHEETFTNERISHLKPGVHKIFRCNAICYHNLVSAHASGCTISDKEYFQTNEMIVYEPKKTLIHFHSVYVSQMDQPPVEERAVQQQPKAIPEKKEVLKEDVRVKVPTDDWKKLFRSRTVCCQNLPFNCDPADILTEFETYGTITRYCTAKGKILIEFENPDSLHTIFKDGDFEWRRRFIRMSEMPRDTF